MRLEKYIKVLDLLGVERVSLSKPRCVFVYTYFFILSLGKEIGPIILYFCRSYQVCLAQVGLAIWNTVACLQYLSSRAQEDLTLAYMIRLYASKIF